MTSLALLLALTAADVKPVVSVLYFENRGGGPDIDVLKKGFADMVITDLVAWDGVTVVERGRLEDVLKELSLQQTKSFDKGTTVKVGKLIGAQYAVTGSLVVSGGKLRVDANVTSIENGNVVASASATDAQDKVFDIEQQLMDSLTQAIDWKVKNRDARKKAKVPNLDALIAYSKAIDLSDQGKADEAHKAMAAVVSKSPTFMMARERKQQLLDKLKEFEDRKRDIITGSALEVGKRADQELQKPFASLSPADKKRFLFWRMTKGRFLARAMKQHLSSRAESLRVIRPGLEAKALEAMKGWAENQRRMIDEARELAKTDAGNSFSPEDSGAWELIRDSMFFKQDGPSSFDVDVVTDTLNDFIVKGRLSDGIGYYVAPPLSVLVPAELDRVLESLTQDVARAEAAFTRAKDKKSFEYPLARALREKAETLDYLRRDDDAAAAYQRVLDLLPTTSDAKDAEEKIQIIIGAKHEWARGEREKYEKAIRDCNDFYVNTEAGWRLHRKGLSGLDEIAADMEKACFGWPGLTYHWDRFYTALASDAATHEDCDRAKKYLLKAFTFGNLGPRSMEDHTKNMAWCNTGLTEASLPSKVRLAKPGGGTGGDKLIEAISPGLEELLVEELGARGVAMEWGGSSNGGVLGLWVTLDAPTKGKELELTGQLDVEGNDDVKLAAPVKGGINVDAFFAPALKALKGKSDPGPRKPNAVIPLDFATGYSSALMLADAKKWKEAQAAFEALAKKYPTFRMASVRARMMAAKASSD